MVTATAVDAPRNSDCLTAKLHGQPAVLILTRTIPGPTGMRRWLVSLDSEVAGTINEQAHGWWGVEPAGVSGCTDRYRDWRRAAQATAEAMLAARHNREVAAKKAAKPAPAGPCRRPGLRLVWSAT